MVLEHQIETGHDYFNEEIYCPGSYIPSHERIIIRCATCQEFFDIHGDKITEGK